MRPGSELIVAEEEVVVVVVMLVVRSIDGPPVAW